MLTVVMMLESYMQPIKWATTLLHMNHMPVNVGNQVTLQNSSSSRINVSMLIVKTFMQCNPGAQFHQMIHSEVLPLLLYFVHWMQLQSWAMAAKPLEIDIVHDGFAINDNLEHAFSPSSSLFSGQIESQQQDSATYIGIPIGAECKALLPRGLSRGSFEVH